MQLQRRPNALPDWLYVAIVAALGVYFVIGGIAWTMFIAPRQFVMIACPGKYSHVGTCFSAAACTTMSASRIALTRSP